MIAVRVKYFQLSRALLEKEEVYTLGAGSHFSDLQKEINRKHPTLTYIVTLALADGSPISPNAELRDGEEVDYLASPAGG